MCGKQPGKLDETLNASDSIPAKWPAFARFQGSPNFVGQGSSGPVIGFAGRPTQSQLDTVVENCDRQTHRFWALRHSRRSLWQISRRALAEIIHGLLMERTQCRELTRSVSEGEP